MSAEVYRKPLPQVDALSASHWDGARDGELRVQRCANCGTLRYPANRWCPQCRGDAADWVKVSGKGQVWSWCVFHRSYFEGFEAELPYAVVLVELDEGIRLYSNLVGVRREDIRIGMRVRAVFEPVTDAITLIKFSAEA